MTRFTLLDEREALRRCTPSMAVDERMALDSIAVRLEALRRYRLDLVSGIVFMVLS